MKLLVIIELKLRKDSNPLLCAQSNNWILVGALFFGRCFCSFYKALNKRNLSLCFESFVFSNAVLFLKTERFKINPMNEFNDSGNILFSDI